MPLPPVGGQSSCCYTYALQSANVSAFNIGDGSIADGYYYDCMTNPNSGCAGLSSSPVGGGTGVQPANPTVVTSTSAIPPVADASTVCPAFSITDPVPAVSCLFRQTAIYLGINVVALFVMIFAIYLIFRPEINAGIQTVYKTAKTAAEAG